MPPVCDTPVTRAPARPPTVRVIVRPLRCAAKRCAPLCGAWASSPDCRFGYAEYRQPGRFALPCSALSPLLNHAWETVQGVSAPVSVRCFSSVSLYRAVVFSRSLPSRLRPCTLHIARPVQGMVHNAAGRTAWPLLRYFAAPSSTANASSNGLLSDPWPLSRGLPLATHRRI